MEGSKKESPGPRAVGIGIWYRGGVGQRTIRRQSVKNQVGEALEGRKGEEPVCTCVSWQTGPVFVYGAWYVDSLLGTVKSEVSVSTSVPGSGVQGIQPMFPKA